MKKDPAVLPEQVTRLVQERWHEILEGQKGKTKREFDSYMKQAQNLNHALAQKYSGNCKSQSRLPFAGVVLLHFIDKDQLVEAAQGLAECAKHRTSAMALLDRDPGAEIAAGSSGPRQFAHSKEEGLQPRYAWADGHRSLWCTRRSWPDSWCRSSSPPAGSSPFHSSPAAVRAWR